MSAQNQNKYYDSVNPDLLSSIPQNASFVLEVGCGAGALGEAYKRANQSCMYYGMELVEDQAKIARRRLDKVVTGDAEKIELDELEVSHDQKFDCIIYGDVLEHLRDPWKLVERHKEWLADDGMMIACIPNIQHWSIIHDLLKGLWKYADRGLMDVTHIRFFTLDSAIELFSRCDLFVKEVVARNVSTYGREGRSNPDKLLEVLDGTLDFLGVDKELFKKSTGALQFIVKSHKKKA